jgi:hypothetical protein
MEPPRNGRQRARSTGNPFVLQPSARDVAGNQGSLETVVYETVVHETTSQEQGGRTLQNLGNNWTTRIDGLSGRPASLGEFGERNSHKSLKAVIGMAILIVLSIVLYEVHATSTSTPTSSSPAITQQTPSAR